MRSLMFILIICCSIFAQQSDAVSAASPQITRQDSLETVTFIDVYTSKVDSLYNSGVLQDYFVPYKTSVGCLNGYSLNTNLLFLKGYDRGEKAVIYWNVYCEKGALRKIEYKTISPTKEMEEILLNRGGDIFDEKKHASITSTYVIYFGDVLQFRYFENGKLIHSKENLTLKKRLIETADWMQLVVQKRQK